ncbi:MAG: choice-of-anchor D domain-containing protein [Terracidiphilus sp.]
MPATGSGHLIVVGWQVRGGGNTSAAINSVTDNAGNTYMEAGAARSIDAVGGAVADFWYAQNSVAGATSLTITSTSTAAIAGAVIWEFSGAAIATPLDQSAVLNSQSSTGAPSGAAVTTTAAGEVVLSLAAVSSNVAGISAGNPFTNDSGLTGNGWAHLITSSIGTYSAQWNEIPAGTYASSTVSFLAAGSYGACDLNQDGAVNILDVQMATNLALSPPAPCAAPYGQCNLAFVQAVLTDAMGGACVLPVLGVAPSGVSFGNVTLGSSGSQTVTVMGTGTSGATISQAIVSGAGFSIGGPALPLTLGVGQTASFNLTFTPAAAGNASGAIVFVSNALNTPVNETLSGTGVAPAPHSVSLSWTPSTSLNVASYNVYRIASSSSTAPATPYTNLASMQAAICSSTVCAYADTAVQSGQSYWYYSTAVDTSNNESAPSNIVQAAVPTP